jgi:hypothetical protein
MPVIPLRRILIEKLIVAQLIKKFSSLYGKRSIVTPLI